MKEPHHGRQQLPGYLSHSQVLDLLKKGLRENPNADILALRGKPNWLDSKIVLGNPNALTKAGWSALSTIFSLRSIEEPKQLLQISKTFLAAGNTQPIGAESLVVIEGLISDLKCTHPDLNFRELSTLCSFLVNVGRHDYTDGHRSIDAVRRRLDSPEPEEETIRVVLGIAVTYLNLPQGTPLSHADAFRRRMRVALQTGDEVSPTNAALFFLETSELPEAQHAVFRQRWERVACQFDNVHSVMQQVADSIRELKKINEHFHTLPRTASTPEGVAEALTGQFRNVQDVSNIFVPQEGHLRLSGPDSDVALEKLAQGTPPEELRNLVDFSRRCRIPLKDAPVLIGLVPPEVQQLLFNRNAPSTSEVVHSLTQPVRSIPEILALIDVLSPLLKAGETTPKVLESLIAFREQSRTHPRLWDTDLAVRFARRTAKKQVATVEPKDLQELRLALALRHRLLKAGYSTAESLQIAWVYAAHKHYRVQELTKLVRALFDPSPRESFTRAMREIALDPRITEDEFRRALGFAAKALDHDWNPIRALYSSWIWGGAFSLSSLREAIGRSQKNRPNELHMELIRSVDSHHVHQVRENLVTFLQSRDSEARSRALNALNTLYHLDQGPYPVYEGPRSSIHPGYKRMMTQVKGVYRGGFDMHYGFGHSTFECKTPPGASDWMLVRFGFDLALRVDRLHATSADRYPGPGCILVGMKLDRIFAKSPYTPEDPYYYFKKAWPWVAREFEDLATTRVLFTRAVKALIGPDLPTYYRDGVHYSLVAWNDHFLNPNLDAVSLVPTVVLLAALKGKHSALRELGESPSVSAENSAHDEALTFPALAAESAARGLNILDLGWASNLGGLCNAYPPRSAPHFEWERELLGHSKDRAGHVHKSHISGRYVHTIDEVTERLLVPLREAHESVHALATTYFNLHDLFRLSLAMWHKGLTISEGMSEMAEPEFTQDNDQRINPHELRMLHEAYRWHGLHALGVTELDAFPVLCIAPALDNWSKVRSPLILDTFDLSLRVTNRDTIRLPQDTGGHGAFEATVWSRLVKPLYFTRADRDLRFLDRRIVTYDDTGSSR